MQTGFGPANLPPVDPVHPSWPARPVPEEGDDGKSRQPPRRDDSERPPQGGETEPGQAGDSEVPGERKPNPPKDDSTGHFVDEYV
jgi:hypothetical protein